MRTFKDWKDVKICCYAMAAGEPEAFIDRWLDSMKGADYITVLITKEDDPNYDYFLKKQKLPEFANKLIIDQKTITPWRFDTARNESMKLIPEDSDVIISTDIDEILIEDFWDDLRHCVFEHPDFERILYQYAWSHDSDTGEPKWFFWYDKITQAKGWHWDYPVHEALMCPNIKELGYHGTYRMDANKIYLHHYPDQTKSRGSYLGLLELRAKEYPDDLYGLYYLSREYTYIGDWESSYKTACVLYSRLFKGDPSPEQLRARDGMFMGASTCLLIGDSLNRLGIRGDAEYYYKKASTYDKSFIDPYIKLAQMYAYSNRPQDCYDTLDEMDKNAKFVEDWRLMLYYWRPWKRYQIIADAKCWESKYDEAYEYIQKGYEDIRSDSDKADAIKEGFYNDMKFILDKVGIPYKE